MGQMKKTTIDEAIARVEDWKGKKIRYENVIGGITNPNYKVTVAGKNFFLKIPGAGTDFIDRDNCHQANIIGMESGAGPVVTHYYDDTGVEIWEWLEGYRQIKFGDIYYEKIFRKIAEAIRDFHNIKGHTLPLKQTLFEQAWDMIERSRGGGYLPPWYDKMLFILERIEKACNKDGIDWKPCHNDFWTNNFMYSDEKDDFKLIDFEYASMNDPYNDLGCFSTTNYLTEAMDMLLSEIYHGGWNEKGYARLKLYKIVADIKWGFWALQQYLFSDVKFDFMNWYGMKTARLQHLWQDPRLDYWINLLNGKPIFRKERKN